MTNMADYASRLEHRAMAFRPEKVQAIAIAKVYLDLIFKGTGAGIFA
jgi:hypothetical protein